MGTKIYNTTIHDFKKILENMNINQEVALMMEDKTIKIELKTFKELLSNIPDTVNLDSVKVIEESTNSLKRKNKM